MIFSQSGQKEARRASEMGQKKGSPAGPPLVKSEVTDQLLYASIPAFRISHASSTSPTPTISIAPGPL